MRIYKGFVLIAAAFLVFIYPLRFASSETSNTTTITITKNQVSSGSPHTVSTFQPSVDLGVIAGLTQAIVGKYLDLLCGLSSGSSGGGIMGAANHLAGDLYDAVVPQSIGSPSQGQSSLSLSGGSVPRPSTVTLTPEQVAAMQQSGSFVTINKVQVPAGTPMLTITHPAATTTTPAQTSGNATAITAPANSNTILISQNGTATGTGEIVLSSQYAQMQMNMPREQAAQMSLASIMPGFTFTLPLAIVLDTFWAPEPNAVTKAKLLASWDISQFELNEFNRMRALGTCVNFMSMGSVSMSTEKFEFRREVGARAEIGLSAQWKGSLRKLTSIQFTDIAMEINDPSGDNDNVNDPLGAQTLRHSDNLLLSDVAERIINALTGKSKSAAKDAGDESLSDKILDKIIGEVGVKVQVVQSTLNRKATVSFKATAKDFSGKEIPLEVASSPITFLSDNKLYPVNLIFPENCPPLKEIKLQPTEVTYNFEEHGYPELVLTGFGQELATGPLLEKAELFTEASQTMTDWVSSGGDMKIVVDQRPVIYPFRGNITVGNPPGGLQGARVRIFTKASDGRESNFNIADSNPAGDFIADLCLFTTGSTQPTPPPYVIEVSKAGYQTITSTGNPERFVKTKDNPLTYQINMPLSTAQMLAVSGKVLDSANKGVADAGVFLTCAGVEYMAISDASGAYQFPSVLFGSTIQLFVNKAGVYFNPETRNVSSGTKTVTVDLKSTVGQRWGDAKFTFSAESGSLPTAVNVLRSSLAKSFSVNIPADGVVRLTLMGQNPDMFTFSKDNYTMTPGSVTAEFTGNENWYPVSPNTPVVPVKEFNIVVASRIPASATLSADKSSIERYGSFYNPAGDKEKAVLTAKVVDSAGRPVGGANVRFEITGSPVKILKEGTRPEGARPNAAYAQSDSSGNAQATICSMRELGAANITAAVYYGDVVYNMRSNGYSIEIVENTRPERAVKPTCSITAEAANLALSGPGVNIAVGGDILFHLNQNANSQLGSLTGYKFLYSKNNGSAQEESFNTAPHPVARKTFTEAGSYNVQYLVKRTFDNTDTWSDPAQAAFTVAAYQPPKATLTLPRTAGSVNLPIDYSFIGEVSAPFKQMLITFGDNQGTIDLDAGLLNGKYYWSGTYFHTYTSEGTYQVKLKVIDQTNAFKEEIKQVTIGSIASLNDHTPPTGSISINNGAASTTGKSALIHASATDDISGVYRMRYSNDGSSWSDWNSVAIDDRPYPSIVKDRVWQLTDGAGLKTVYVQFKDAADNVSPSITDTIELQAAGIQASGSLGAPQVTATGYQGAPMPRGSIAITSRSGNNISVTFSATNDWAIFVNQMSLSFDNQNWSGWMPSEPNKQISLEGHLDATKLYVIFADAAGGMSPSYSADIPAAPAAQAVAAVPAETQAQAASGGSEGQQAAETQKTATGAGSREDKLSALRKQREMGSREAAKGAVESGTTEEVVRQDKLLSKRAPAQEAKIEAVALPDLSVEDIRLPRELLLGEPAEVVIYLNNDSATEIRDCPVYFEAQDGFQEKSKVTFAPRSRQQFKVTWVPKQAGRQRLMAVIDYPNDANARNNKYSASAEVASIEENSMQMEKERDSRNPILEDRKGVIDKRIRPDIEER